MKRRLLNLFGTLVDPLSSFFVFSRSPTSNNNSPYKLTPRFCTPKGLTLHLTRITVFLWNFPLWPSHRPSQTSLIALAIVTCCRWQDRVPSCLSCPPANPPTRPWAHAGSPFMVAISLPLTFFFSHIIFEIWFAFNPGQYSLLFD